MIMTSRAKKCKARLYAAVFHCALVSAFGVAYARTPKEVKVVEFNESMLRGVTSKEEINKFTFGNPIISGNYRSDIYINDVWRGRQDVRIEATKDIYVANVCLSKSISSRLELDLDRVEKSRRSELESRLRDPNVGNGPCIPVHGLAEGITAKFDASALRLDVGIPQALLAKKPKDYVPEQALDNGVPGAAVNYHLNTYNTDQSGKSTQTIFGYMDAGLSAGDWRLKHIGNFFKSDSGSSKYKSNQTYLRRDIYAISGALSIGKLPTQGALFDTVNITGLHLNSDDRMLPASLRGYAPVIRGQARTNARVTIKRRDVVIYQAAVPPGAFVIDDLYSAGYGGNFVVTVTEADGSESSFEVSYAATPLLLREGGLRYSLAYGNFDEGGISYDYPVAQGAVSYGVLGSVTASGGAIGSDRFKSNVFGLAYGSPIGAFSVDWTNSEFVLFPGQKPYKGNSLRSAYSLSLAGTDTNFTVASYQNSSENYYSLRDAMAIIGNSTAYAGVGYRAKERLVLNVSQSLGRFGNMYLSLANTSYWTSNQVSTDAQIGWTRNIGEAMISLSAQTSNYGDKSVDRLSAGLSFPIGAGPRRSLISSQVSSSSQGESSSNIGASGQLNDAGTLQYGVNGSTSSGVSSGGLNLNYQTRYGDASVFASSSGFTNSYSIGVRGGLVAHSEGLIVTPPLGETITIVRAKDAAGASLRGTVNSKINASGYGVVRYVSPYSLNVIEVDPAGVANNVNLLTTSEQVAPKSGTITKVEFNTEKSRLVLIQALDSKQRPLPFGASVTDETGKVVGSVGQASKIQARLQREVGTLFVDVDSSSLCEVSFKLPAESNLVTNLLGVCVPRAKPGKPAVPSQFGQQPGTVPSVDASKAGTSPGKEISSLSPEQQKDNYLSSATASLGSFALPVLSEVTPQQASDSAWIRVGGTAVLPNGEVVPKGASIHALNETNSSMSSIAQDGRFMLRVKKGVKELEVRFADGFRSCRIQINESNAVSPKNVCM